MVIRAVVAGGRVFCCIADTIPVRANLMAHAAVGRCLAGATSCVTGEAGGALVVRRTSVFVADSIVANLVAETHTDC